MVGDHRLLAQTLRHLVSDALDQASGVDEHQCRLMALDQLRYAVQRRIPLLVGSDRTQLALG